MPLYRPDWATMTKQIIKITDLTFNYGVSKGIQDLNLSIDEGEIFGFLGENGAGKTTTIRCMMTILIQHQGDIVIDGVTVSRDDFSYKEEIGYLPGELMHHGRSSPYRRHNFWLPAGKQSFHKCGLHHLQ